MYTCRSKTGFCNEYGFGSEYESNKTFSRPNSASASEAAEVSVVAVDFGEMKLGHRLGAVCYNCVHVCMCDLKEKMILTIGCNAPAVVRFEEAMLNSDVEYVGRSQKVLRVADIYLSDHKLRAQETAGAISSHHYIHI